MANRIDITIESRAGREPRSFTVKRMYNFGSATRAPETARAHQEEVAKVGIHIAFDIPAPRIYPIGTHALTTGHEVEAQGDRSSGEVEIAILVADQVYVGVGSDHTDRALETVSIPWSKQVTPNVLAPVMWPLEEMRARWDACVLRSWVGGRKYQEVGTSAFLHPDDMLRVLRERVSGLPERDFMVFGGTIVSLDKELGFGPSWSFELEDPEGGRAIRHAYEIANLFDGIRDGFRVPVRNPVR
jgi:hypothetical protein